MGFVGGTGNIANTTALPPSLFFYCIVNSKSFMNFIYLIVYRCLRLRFLDVKTNPGPRRPVPAVCRILCSNVRGLAGNLSDLTVASSQYDILLCSETLVSDMRHVSEVLVPCLVVSGQDFANQNLSVIVAKWWFLGFVVRDRTLMCTVFIATLT